MDSCFRLLRRRGKLWLVSFSECLKSMLLVFFGVSWTDTAVRGVVDGGSGVFF
jgi:hypothetical protein